MNERIRELADQAGLEWGPGGYADYSDFDHSLFAELIVQDCISKIESKRSSGENNDQWTFTRDLCYHNMILDLKEHFGIKENKGWICPKCGTDRTKAACPRGYSAAVDDSCPMIGEAQ